MSRARIPLTVIFGLVVLARSAVGAPPTMTRAEIVDRAEYGVDYSYWWGHGCWRTDDQSHGSCSGNCPSCTHSGSYGADCSGFVAKCWQVPVASALDQDSHPYSTSNFRWDSTHWSQIAWGDALTADAFVHRNAANTGGHIVLYDSGDPWGQSWVWEAKGCSYGILHDLKSFDTSYVAIRRDALSEAPEVGTLRGVVFEDQGVGPADMSIRIPGASVECLGQGTTQASAPDAEWSFDLSPGSYTVMASATGYLSGSRTCQVNAGQESWCSVGLVAECVPDCSGRACGLDPVCGEPCGECPVGDACAPDGHCETVETCSPDCAGRVCGLDPVCDEPCGVCPPSLLCDGAGQCVPIEPAGSKLYGFVVAVPAGTPAGDLSGHPPVAGAALSLDGSEMGTTDRYGYYEVSVDPGSYQVSAAADGFDPGTSTCTVGAHESVQCLVPVYVPGAQPGEDAGVGPQRIQGVHGGCGCAATGDRPPVGEILIVLLLILGFRRRLRANQL